MPPTFNKEITIYDIAEKLGIVASTVSRALQDHPKVSKTTKEKVNALATNLGFRPNNFASNLRSQKTQTIGVIIPKLDNPFMSSLIAGMEKILSREKYNLIIAQSLESYQKEVERSAMMFKSRIDGLLVSLSTETIFTNHFESYLKRKLPVVFFDRAPKIAGITSVTIDNRLAACQATEHLIQQGCRNIVHITIHSEINVYSDRLQGYKDALANNGIDFESRNVIFGDLSREFGAKAAGIIVSMDVRPDGVFVANDICAISCIGSLIKAGYNIPRDIAVVGFNNDPIATVVEPNLTSVAYSGIEMGEVAVQCLLNQLNVDPFNRTHQKIILNSSLVTRGSSIRRSF